MSDLNEWIKERRRIHNAATEGPWKQDEEDGVRGVDLYTNAEDEEFEDRWERQDADIRTWDADDATFIADAHNNLLAALTMIEDVLELHQAVYLGTLRIKGEPDDIRYGCVACNSHYPCQTVQSVRSAIERSE